MASISDISTCLRLSFSLLGQADVSGRNGGQFDHLAKTAQRLRGVAKKRFILQPAFKRTRCFLFLKQIEDGFDTLLEKLFGSDLTNLPLEDEEFKEHIDANRMSLWLLVVMLLIIVVVTTMAVYAVLETRETDMQLLSVFSMNPEIVTHSLPLSAVSFSFAIIWRNVFNNYAAKFHSETLKRQNLKFFAAGAVFFALLASSIAFFTDVRLYGTMVMLYYLALTLAFLFALIFSSKMYHLIKSVASRDKASGASGVEAHQRFPALAHLTLGWCGTNALTTVAMFGFSAILLSYQLFADSFHILHVDNTGDQSGAAHSVYDRIVWLEFILLLIFLLMGFFLELSGVKQRPISFVRSCYL